jgi:hypothetical protein
MIVAVAESKHCCWIPKSTHSKENERNNKKGKREGWI